jgi:predicted phosphoadenosine phosphosulfate sulfurtransferase
VSRRRQTGDDVFQAAYDRIAALYRHGDRVTVSVSGGKDSTVVLELSIMVARDLGKLPVDVVMRDEEIMYPGTFEYLHRVAERIDDVDFHWVIAGQPIINAFDRFNPYWWVFDPEEEDRWVRGYPGHGEPQLPDRPAYWIPEKVIQYIGSMGMFPLDSSYPGWADWDRLTPEQRIEKAIRLGRDGNHARVVYLTGLRVEESRARLFGLLSSANYLLKPNHFGGCHARPIYDWTTGDVWRFIKEHDLDYNEAYNVMTRYGMPGRKQRIAPPTMNAEGIEQLTMARKAWPRWWHRVTERIPGLHSAAMFGKRAVQPIRTEGQTWEDVVCTQLLDRSVVPDWLADRVQRTVDGALNEHSRHSTAPFPDVSGCQSCSAGIRSWRTIATFLWNGDPFATKSKWLKYIEPEQFRTGAGTWGSGSPTW